MAPSIRLTVPGTLRYRAVAVRAVAEAARLVSGSAQRDASDPFSLDVRDPFDTAVVSAFMEIFNNVAIHAYNRDGDQSTIDLAITPDADQILIEIRDHGEPFNIGEVAPLPDTLDEHSLPEGGMGLHIAKTMLDEVHYQPGPPNVWRLRKNFEARGASS